MSNVVRNDTHKNGNTTHCFRYNLKSFLVLTFTILFFFCTVYMAEFKDFLFQCDIRKGLINNSVYTLSVMCSSA